MEFTPEELATEKWKTISEFPEYKVSTLGRFKSYRIYKNGKILNPHDTKGSKYLVISTSVKKIRLNTRNVIYSVFGGPISSNERIITIDKNRDNLRFSNLKKVSKQEFEKRSGEYCKLNFSIEVDQYSLDDIFIKRWPSMREAAISIGNSSYHSAIARCSKGLISKAYGFKWKRTSNYVHDRLRNLPNYIAIEHCHENGKVINNYPSITNAALDLNLTPGTINGYLRTGKCKKFIFRKSHDSSMPIGSFFRYADGRKPSVVESIRSFMMGGKSSYATEGKEANTLNMMDVVGSSSGPLSFLSMPEKGRELKAWNNRGLLDLPASLGIERDKTMFSAALYSFKKFFPGLRMERADINEYVKESTERFNVAHLDYNGPLLKSHYESLDKLTKQGSISFITVQDTDYFENRYKGQGLQNSINLQEIYNNFHIVYENIYEGINKVPMITLGVIK
jgi:hypothetical protein